MFEYYGFKWTQIAKLIRDIPAETSNTEKASQLLAQVAEKENAVLS